MKITAAIVTRGRPAALVGVIMSLWRLRSGAHTLEFSIGVDRDDGDTPATIPMLLDDKVPLSVYAWDRGDTRGHVVNNLMRQLRDADVITPFTDWTFPLTPGWDDIMAQGAQQFPKRLTWWSCPHIPGCVLPSIPRAWLDAAGWRISPEIFPFWWDDTWIEEVDIILSRGAPCLKLPAAFAGTHGKTTRGRDFEFWANIFAGTRHMRIAQAERMAETLGLPKPEISPAQMARFEANDRFQLEKADEFERIFGDGSAPTEAYLRVKSAALRLIQPAMSGAAA